jgi:hypothetical protein
MLAFVTLALFATAIARPLLVVAFAVWVCGPLFFYRVSKDTGSPWLAGAVLLVWWGGMQFIGVKLLVAGEKWKARPWCLVAKDILGNAHVAGVCLFWLGFLVLHLVRPEYDDYARKHSLLAFLLAYGLMAALSVVYQSGYHLRRYLDRNSIREAA